MSTELASRKATYQDVLDAPENMVAEILGGVLQLHPRPAGPHTVAAAQITSQLHPPFNRAKGGPGGWIILGEPELHLHDDIVVPDIAGWRRTTMSHVPADLVYHEIRPDWICEVLSRSTEQLDRTIKLSLYAREGVEHAWLVDPRARTLEIYRNELGGEWTSVATLRDDQRAHAEPFEAIEFDLGELWSDVGRRTP